MLWHRRLGHLNFRMVRELIRSGTIDNVCADDLPRGTPTCLCCVQGKIRRRPFARFIDHSGHKPGELLYTDIKGPMEVPARGGMRYYEVFVDAKTRYIFIALLPNRQERTIVAALTMVIDEARTSTRNDVRAIHSTTRAKGAV